jgi:O-antigen/teichoic acid export membrane protein
MQQIGRNIVSLLFSRVIAGIILFLIYTRLLQYFGPNVAGQYGLLVGFLTVFNFFVDLGMQQLIIKKVSENKAEASKYLSNYFAIQLLLGIGFMLILDSVVFLAHYPEVVKHALYITGLSLLITSLSYPFMSIINAFQKLGIMAKINFINSLINASMMFLTVLLHKGIFFMAFSALAVGVFDFGVYWYITEKNFTHFSIKFDFPFWKKLLVLNLPFTLLTFFSIYNRIDTLLLPHLRNFTENGYYTAVYKFWDTLAFLPAVVTISLYPFFAESMAAGRVEDARKGLVSYTRYMIALALPLTVGAFLLSDKLTLAFFGPAFAPASHAMWVLVAAVSVLFIYSPINGLIITERTRAAVKITGFNLFFNIVANLILIPKFGFVAAAWTTLASEFVQWIGYTYIINKQVLKFNYLPDFIKPGIAVAIMALVVWSMRNMNLWLIIGVAALVYFLMLLGLKFFRKDDRQLLFGGLRINPAPIERDVL